MLYFLKALLDSLSHDSPVHTSNLRLQFILIAPSHENPSNFSPPFTLLAHLAGLPQYESFYSLDCGYASFTLSFFAKVRSDEKRKEQRSLEQDKTERAYD